MIKILEFTVYVFIMCMMTIGAITTILYISDRVMDAKECPAVEPLIFMTCEERLIKMYPEYDVESIKSLCR